MQAAPEMVICKGRVLQMGFDVTFIRDCFRLSGKQIREVLLTIVLPVTAGIAFIAPQWPSLITDGRTLNICLVGFVAALPVVLISNVVWALLFFAFLERIFRVVAVSFLLSSPGLKNNQRARGEARKFYEEMFAEVPVMEDIRSQSIKSFDFRHTASICTAIGFYLTAIVICLFKPGALISALTFLVVVSLPPICSLIIGHAICSELQSILSKMTHHQIITHVSEFLGRHFSSDFIQSLRSGLYVVLNADRNVSLTETLDTRLKLADGVWSQAGKIQEEQPDEHLRLGAS